MAERGDTLTGGGGESFSLRGSSSWQAHRLIASVQNLKRLVAAGKPPIVWQIASFDTILKLQLVAVRAPFGHRLFRDFTGIYPATGHFPERAAC